MTDIGHVQDEAVRQVFVSVSRGSRRIFSVLEGNSLCSQISLAVWNRIWDRVSVGVASQTLARGVGLGTLISMDALAGRRLPR